MGNRKVICAGCSGIYLAERTHFYRKKRCCGLDDCYAVIDKKIKHSNYEKQRRKYSNGTHRRGVEPSLRKLIMDRDNNICVLCCEDKDRLQVHHIVPVSKSGSDHESNLITLCSQCHTIVHQKGDERYVEEFKDYTKIWERETAKSG